MVRSLAAALLAAAVLAPAALAQTPPAQAPAANLDMAKAIQKFDPGANHFIWLLPPGMHGDGPWAIDVELKHKGESKYKTSIPLKAEIIGPGDHFRPHPGYEAVRLSDAGQWQPVMAEVQKRMQAIIAQYGRGDGELILQNNLHTKLDEQGKKLYCTEKKVPEVRLLFEETEQKKISMIDAAAMQKVADRAVLENCGK